MDTNDNNIIKLINGVEISENDIFRVAEEYINNILDFPEDITKKRNTFYGCLKYIYSKLFQPSKYDRIINNQSCLVSYSDIFSLYSLYDCFIDLCCKYHMEFTQNSFYFFSGITVATLQNWKEEIKIPEHDISLANSLWVHYAKKIFNNSELALHNSMLDGNLMAYATLKCWYGWPQTQQITIAAPVQSAANIAQKYSSAALQAPPIQESFCGSQNTQENIVQVSGSQNSFLSPGN